MSDAPRQLGNRFETGSTLPIDYADSSTTQTSIGATDARGGRRLCRSFALEWPLGTRSAPSRAFGAGAIILRGVFGSREVASGTRPPRSVPPLSVSGNFGAKLQSNLPVTMTVFS